MQMKCTCLFSLLLLCIVHTFIFTDSISELIKKTHKHNIVALCSKQRMIRTHKSFAVCFNTIRWYCVFLSNLPHLSTCGGINLLDSVCCNHRISDNKWDKNTNLQICLTAKKKPHFNENYDESLFDYETTEKKTVE